MHLDTRKNMLDCEFGAQYSAEFCNFPCCCNTHFSFVITKKANVCGYQISPIAKRQTQNQYCFCTSSPYQFVIAPIQTVQCNSSQKKYNACKLPCRLRTNSFTELVQLIGHHIAYTPRFVLQNII
jgi:hypothetical protein